ncbi:MAG TPA: T9SS type A sorting domain-containing protein [Chitinophagaceae bacterium]|nr:T9SS type A sorting domain-containing protein [Chitinophagaceae bacterium]
MLHRTPTANPRISKAVLAFVLSCLLLSAKAQYNVTEIITDYNGYWKSGASAVSNVKPDNSHNLVSFSFNGTRYSTGVNDNLLTQRQQSFVAGDFRALPLKNASATVGGNTKIGLGAMYDGVEEGASATPPSNNIAYYLTDGVKGLDLGTCVANLPAGTLYFPVSKILKPSIGDNIPDMVITQVADPSGSLDRYEFTDILGNRVGNYVDINLSNIPPVGNWTADFYEASRNPMTLAGGFTKTDRAMRLWATDLATFGINSSNAQNVAYFKITLSGNSDVAFVAYNNNAINIFTSLLPATLSNLSARNTSNGVTVDWTSSNEINSASYIVERSTDGSVFTPVSKVLALNNPMGSRYTSADPAAPAGKLYYRLQMVDRDGRTTYSKVVTVIAGSSSTRLRSFPNPAKDQLTVLHPFAGSHDKLTIVNLQGITVLQQSVVPGSFQTRVSFTLPAGLYEVVLTDGQQSTSNRLVIQ